MPLTTFDRGHGRWSLMGADATTGWIAENTIGFRGFEDRDAALGAAAVAYEVLTDWLARQRRLDAIPRQADALQVRGDGADEQLVLGNAPVGRLFRIGNDINGGDYAFELLLPPEIHPSLSVAATIYRAIERRRAVRDIERALALA